MYDNTCKFIAETFPRDIANWLLGKPIALTKLEPSELSVEPIRADSLILLQSEEVILHAEFQTKPSADIFFRMADYRLRAYRRYPGKLMRQVVVYLRKSASELVYQNEFEINNLRSNFEIIRLWEQPTELFLDLPGLLPFAVLSATNSPDTILRQVSQEIEQIDNTRQQSNVAGSVAILAGLVLEKELINRVLRQDIMRESVIYQELIAEGRQEGEASLVLRLLQRRIGEITPKFQNRIRGLSVEQLEELGEALLDFSTQEDLEAWFSQSQM